MSQEGRTNVVDALKSDLSDLIDSGQLRDGDRLPTERDLAVRYQASRAVVRRVLDALERDGRIVRHVGRGTFVASATPPPDLPGHQEMQDVSPADLSLARLLLEPSVAEYAAIHATTSDLAKIKECLAKSNAAGDAKEFEHWDAHLHTAIAAAAHNTFLMLIMEAINEARRSTAWQNLTLLTATPTRRTIHSRDHGAIVDALVSRDAAAAREAMYRHLENVNRLQRGASVP